MRPSGAIRACIRFAAAGGLSAGAATLLLGVGLADLSWIAVPLLLWLAASQIAAMAILTTSALDRVRRLGVVGSMRDRPSLLPLWKSLRQHPLAGGAATPLKAGWTLGGLGTLAGGLRRLILDPWMGRNPGDPFFILPAVLGLFFTFHALAEFGVMKEREDSDSGRPSDS